MDSINPSNSTSEELYLASSKFACVDELLTNVRAYYATRGYGLSVRNSKKDKFIILKCGLGGCYRDTRCIPLDQRVRSTGTRLVNCPFKISGKKKADGFLVVEVKDLSHNHEPSIDTSGHPSFRQLEPEDVQCVKDMTTSGIAPRQILSSLRKKNPNLPANSKNIYNLKTKIRKDNLAGRSPISVLFEELEKGGFTHNILENSEGHITRLFIAHPLSIKLAKTFPNTFVMDCTYKTNKYKMPLLDIVGVSCFNTTFYSGFAFLEKEDEENYIWALNTFKNILAQDNQPSVIVSDRELVLMNAIKVVFPTTKSLLCVWHIEKNVLSNCKKSFSSKEDFDIFMSSWNKVIYSPNEDLFLENWGEFDSSYKERKDVIEYIQRTWLPWKEKFVSAWTEKYFHLGSRSSSRVEGAHAKLKMYLQVSTGGLQEVKDKICLAFEHEFNEIKVKLSSERIRVPHNCNIPLFRELLSNVSLFALKEIYKQYEKVKEDKMTSCTGHFTATMGLPCSHKIKSCRGTLSLDLVHPQWRIDIRSLNVAVDSQENGNDEAFVNLLGELHSKYQQWPLDKKEIIKEKINELVNQSDNLFDPLVQRSKGRPPKSKKRRGVNSTKRDPWKFELVESSRRHSVEGNNRVQETEPCEEVSCSSSAPNNTSFCFILNASPDDLSSFI